MLRGCQFEGTRREDVNHFYVNAIVSWLRKSSHYNPSYSDQSKFPVKTIRIYPLCCEPLSSKGWIRDGFGFPFLICLRGSSALVVLDESFSCSWSKSISIFLLVCMLICDLMYTLSAFTSAWTCKMVSSDIVRREWRYAHCARLLHSKALVGRSSKGAMGRPAFVLLRLLRWWLYVIVTLTLLDWMKASTHNMALPEWPKPFVEVILHLIVCRPSRNDQWRESVKQIIVHDRQYTSRFFAVTYILS